MKKTLLFACMLLVMLSCKKEITETSECNYSPLTFTTSPVPTGGKDSSGKIELGSDKGIPFSLKNMRAAANFINDNSNLGLSIILPTHYYVQFKPTTEEHLISLDSLSNIYALYNYPIEYEIVQEGTHLSTSTSTYNKYDPLYASIPVGDILPDIPYSVIDTLCDPDEDDNDITIVSYVLTGNSSELGILYNGETFTENTLKEYLALPNETRASNKYLPCGYLKVYDTQKGNYVPVKNTQLKFVRFGIAYNVTTNENGYFEFKKKISGKITLKACWKNGSYTIRKSWNEMIGIATADYIVEINKNNTGSDFKIEKNNPHLWYKATVSNSLFKYNKHMESCGLNGVRGGANVWVVLSENGAGGAALMARKYAWSVTYNAIFTDYLGYMLPISYPITTLVNLLFRNLYPDLIFSISNSRFDTEYIDKLVFHEAGHFSHGLKAGNIFWGNFVQNELSNILNCNRNPYGDGTTPSISAGKRIALSEGWATFCEYKCMNYYYSGYNVEYFNMETIPSSEYENWFLTGLFWDIFDNVIDSNSKLINGQTGALINYIEDNLQIGNINSLSSVYSKLTSTTNSGNDLKSKLITSYPSKSSQINKLFTSYGY